MTIMIIGLLVILVGVLMLITRFIKELDTLSARIDSLIGQNMEIYDKIETVESELKNYSTKTFDIKTNL